MPGQNNEPKTYTDRLKTLDSFRTAYWSGLDVALYCGDVWVDEALQFSVQAVEQVNPYYGYASFTADRLHHGVRIFTGEFTINFKHSNYIFAVLQDINRSESPGGSQLDLPINFNPAIGAGSITGGASVEDSVKSYVEFAKSFSKLRQAQDASAQRILDSKAVPQMTAFGPLFHGPKKGFELTVLFGAQLNDSLMIDFDGSEYTRHKTPVRNRLPSVATGFRLLGVSLTGSHLMINDSGQPIMETYNFIARGYRTLTGADIFGYTDAKR